MSNQVVFILNWDYTMKQDITKIVKYLKNKSDCTLDIDLIDLTLVWWSGKPVSVA